MVTIKLLAIVLVAAMAPIPYAFAATVYATDFDSVTTTAPGVVAAWSHTATTNQIPNHGQPGFTTPTNYLGGFHNQTVTLSLSNLPGNDPVRLAFRLLIIDSWDGNSGGIGPDVFTLGVAGGPTLLSTTFANNPDTVQDYPTANSPMRSASGGLYGNPNGAFGFGGAAWYDLSFEAATASGAIQFNFTVSGLQPFIDESWGLDNVSVTTNDVPEPRSILMFFTGVSILAVFRRIRR